MTLRLSKQTRRRVARIARNKRVPVSRLMCEAIESLVEREEGTGTVYEAIKDLIGIVHGGNPKRSTATGRQFTEMLKRRRGRS